MLNNQSKKENKFNRKIIRTCIHQPFEFNMRTLDQTKSQELAKSIIKISDILNVKCGIKSAIRKLRAKSVEMIAVILILDQNIMEIMLQAATVFWKYEVQIILARDDAKTILNKHFKINKINCIYIYNNPNIEEEQAQTIQEFKSFIATCQQESKCEIPIIIDDKDIKLKQLRILHHTQLIEQKQTEKQQPKQQQPKQKQEKQVLQSQQQQEEQQQQQKQLQQPQQEQMSVQLQKIENTAGHKNENETEVKQSLNYLELNQQQSIIKQQQMEIQSDIQSSIQQVQVFDKQLVDNQIIGFEKSLDTEDKVHIQDKQLEKIEKEQIQIEEKK